MIHRYLVASIVAVLIVVATTMTAHAQEGTPPVPDTTVSADDSAAIDSLTLRPTRRSSLDTTISWNAKDSTIMDIRRRKARLYGNAVLVKGSIRLTADYIEVDFNTNELVAETRYDSTTGRYVGEPVILRDGATEYTASRLSYNFRTRQGTVTAAETKFDDGYFYAKKIKKVTDDILFGSEAAYTTCDAPHPHYYFTTPRIKVVSKDRMFLDQVTLNVADVPMAYLPIGIFFPSRGGRNSGLIIPQFGPRGNLGFGIEGLGYFFDINEYVDYTLTTDLYSKGGFTLRNLVRGRLRGVIQQADLNVTYGQRRNDPDEPLDRSWIFNYAHAQKIGRTTDISGSFNYATRNAIRNTTTRVNEFDRIQDITTQNLTSDLSYSTSWRWGGSLRASHRRTQNIITDALTAENQASLSFPTVTPFASSTGDGGIFENFSLSGGLTFTNQGLREDPDSNVTGGFRTRDTRNGVSFNPSIGINPKLGVFTITPSIGANAGLFFRRLVKTADVANDTVLMSYVPGLFPTYSYNFGIGVTTKVFGLVQPRVWGINAIRHTAIPSINFRYTPDFGRLGLYYDQFYNPQTNRVEKYSIFETDGSLGHVPSSNIRNLITFDLQNQFDAKIAQGDTLEDKKVTFLTLNLATAFDATRDSVKWDDIRMNAKTNFGAFGYLSANASLNLYVPDTLGAPTAALLMDRGEWFPRVSSAGVSFGTSFSDQGFTTGTSAGALGDSAAARRARFDFEPVAFDDKAFFGEHVRGAEEFRIPWNIGLSGSYNVAPSATDRGEFEHFFNVGATFEFSPTPTTRINSSVSYNVREKKFVIPTISIYKDLHCWEMSFNWNPGGEFSSGFYFKLSLKSAQLRDIKLERTAY